MKHVFLALVLAIASFASNAKDIVLYINGASADATWPEKQAKAFYEKMKANGIKINTTTEFSYYPIPQSDVGSAIAISCQREISAESFPTKSVRPTPSELSLYYKTLGRMYDDMWLTALKNPSCNGTLPGIAKMYSSVLGLAKSLKKLVDEKHNVTIASYSMGNNYAEAAIAYLYHKGFIKSLSDIKTVGIGAPTFTATGEYVNATYDSVVYVTLLEPYSLPPTITYCIDPCSGVAEYQDLLDNGGISGHILLEDYLNDKFFSWAHKKRVSSLIADKISATYGETVSLPSVSVVASSITPKVGEEVTFTATASTTNGDKTIKSYSWSFGDGDTSLGNNTNVIKHTYKTTGNFAVFVNVQDNVGAQKTSDNIFVNPVPNIGAPPTVTNLAFSPATGATSAKLQATFDIDMSPSYTTTGAYVPKSGKEGYWPNLRTFVIEFDSYTPGGVISLEASGFRSAAGAYMAANRTFTFPALGAVSFDVTAASQYEDASNSWSSVSVSKSAFVSGYSNTKDWYIVVDTPSFNLANRKVTFDVTSPYCKVDIIFNTDAGKILYYGSSVKVLSGGWTPTALPIGSYSIAFTPSGSAALNWSVSQGASVIGSGTIANAGNVVSSTVGLASGGSANRSIDVYGYRYAGSGCGMRNFAIQ